MHKNRLVNVNVIVITIGHHDTQYWQ